MLASCPKLYNHDQRRDPASYLFARTNTFVAVGVVPTISSLEPRPVALFQSASVNCEPDDVRPPAAVAER